MTWMRRCPMCRLILREDNLEKPWICACGWTTKREPHEPTTTH
jgi:hypothetical protein